ncbi:hypothetical protein [Rhizobium nepotum]|uniref:hypothetical protein n=1 Tax=Rhizobium nepotum TaxID=1035271 RepID=UPI003CF35518
MRLPDNPDHFLLSRSRSPEQVTAEDILVFDRNGEPIEKTDDALYSERVIHARIFAALARCPGGRAWACAGCFAFHCHRREARTCPARGRDYRP